MRYFSSLALSFLLFGGVAIAHHKSYTSSSSTETNSAAVTPSSSGVYQYHVTGPYHREGMLVFDNDELSFICENHPKHSMSWNYNMFHKVKLGPGDTQITLVFHGGDTETFTVTGGSAIASDLPEIASTRIAAAPRYDFGS